MAFASLKDVLGNARQEYIDRLCTCTSSNLTHEECVVIVDEVRQLLVDLMDILEQSDAEAPIIAAFAACKALKP